MIVYFAVIFTRSESGHSKYLSERHEVSSAKWYLTDWFEHAAHFKSKEAAESAMLLDAALHPDRIGRYAVVPVSRYP